MDHQDRPRLQLGLFMPNCNHVYSFSSYKPVPDDWTFVSNKAIAIAAKKAGFDFLFPLGKWKGWGGSTDVGSLSLETTTWASALLAVTERIQVYSTVHVPMFHPLVMAKMGATLDHISNGRWGLNVVSGFSSETDQIGKMLLPTMSAISRPPTISAFSRGYGRLSLEPSSIDRTSTQSKMGSSAPYLSKNPIHLSPTPVFLKQQGR